MKAIYRKETGLRDHNPKWEVEIVGFIYDSQLQSPCAIFVDKHGTLSWGRLGAFTVKKETV